MYAHQNRLLRTSRNAYLIPLSIMTPRSTESGRGSKAKYTSKQQRMAEHIEEGYEKRGTPKRTAERRAWATVNKVYGGGLKGGSGHARQNKSPMRKGGTAGARAAASRPAAARKASARKAARTRARKES
jgi:hypothetical protein